MSACPECHCGECGHVAPKLLSEPCGHCGHVGHRYMHSAYVADDPSWPMAAPIEEHITFCELEWTPDGIDSYVDGELVCSFAKDKRVLVQRQDNKLTVLQWPNGEAAANWLLDTPLTDTELERQEKKVKCPRCLQSVFTDTAGRIKEHRYGALVCFGSEPVGDSSQSEES